LLPDNGSRADLPLSGITVADFSWVLAGPRATSWLGAMGARVIKIEGPRRPDQYRAINIFVPGKEGREGSGAFHNLNHTKLGCSIDFNHPKGLELAKRIVALSDIVVENFSYGVMDRVGLGYDELKKLRPDIIMVSSSAMGKTGPDKANIAYGTLIHAFAGLNSVTGYADAPAGTVGGTYADPLTGTTMVFAILAALWHRRRTGKGQLIDLSMVEATMMQLPEFILDYAANGRFSGPQGNARGIAAPHDCYPCADEQWVAIAVESDEDWGSFCSVLGDPDWCSDARFSDQPSRFENKEALNKQVAAWTRTKTAEEVTELLQGAGIAAAPSYDAQQLYEDPQLRSRDFYIDVDHPVVGKMPIMGLPWRTEPDPARQFWAAPTFGQHTGHVLHDILGIDEAEIASLHEEGVIA
jgi:crotonobetainyl-CoA:carnitine CoA-transferase CaiB-like acyl-CoA transferase